jgi:hypothetical protein
MSLSCGISEGARTGAEFKRLFETAAIVRPAPRNGQGELLERGLGMSTRPGGWNDVTCRSGLRESR